MPDIKRSIATIVLACVASVCVSAAVAQSEKVADRVPVFKAAPEPAEVAIVATVTPDGETWLWRAYCGTKRIKLLGRGRTVKELQKDFASPMRNEKSMSVSAGGETTTRAWVIGCQQTKKRK